MGKADRKSEFEQEAWAILRERRRSAKTFPLNILVWGPSNDGTSEYKARCKIREELKKRGHNAEFSEDLCKSPEAIHDPMEDEFLQADSAHAIIMIYGSRGTQSERDMILSYTAIAQKAYILIKEDVWSNVMKSVSSTSWDKMTRFAKIIKYKGPELIVDKVDELCDEIEKRRTEYYVIELQSRRRA